MELSKPHYNGTIANAANESAPQRSGRLGRENKTRRVEMQSGEYEAMQYIKCQNALENQQPRSGH